MSRITPKLAFGLAALLLGAGLASAESRLNPMAVLAGRPAGSDPLDPMTAVRATAATTDAEAGNIELGGLPDGPGAEETYFQCVACHSTEIIKQQRVTDHRWDELWSWMVEAQGMIEPEPEAKELILGYLKTQFSSER